MKILKKIVILTVLCVVSLAYADHYNFYWHSGVPVYVNLKDGTTYAPVNNKAQAISAASSGNIQPPTNNPANFYLDSSNLKTTTTTSQDIYIGYDYINGGTLGAGQCYAIVSRDGTDGTGWLRAFSSTTVPNSAYYVDGDYAALTFGGGDQSCGDKNIDQVNPAYIIPWSNPPATNFNATSIVGVVDTAASDNNKLTDSDVKVQVREKPSGSWEDHSLPYTPGYAGNFEVRAIFVSGNLPVSATYDVDGVIPEPALASILILAALAFFRRK
ncbi:MAG: hypothetical protein GY865_20365 [candidate division Zixibacteria bacterium]|nr:hypothetical protein [candidate division Zixibacteria bacterium]